ncbi:glycosyltransferase [Bacillus dakarensis]|uniref:glycosyltransferase n=1 Tax=Robertmurraya dakarensis TaxID=1926278 RepID=UPI000981D106|nr:glycosyltransferase [Bacillus dakarensis]
MKSIIIVTRRMIMGGIERALISMLEKIPKDQYNVTILVMGSGGELLDKIPSHVKVKCMYGNEKTTGKKIWNLIKRRKFIDAFKVGLYTSLAKRANSVFKQEMYLSKTISFDENRYDLAIAYHVPASFPVVYVADQIIANKKVAWIHSDVSKYKNSLGKYRRFYHKYDKIFCVSYYSMLKFNELFPEFKETTSVFYNILDKEKLKCMSEENIGFEDSFNGIRILTVGRLTPEKGQDLIPNILRRLVSEGYNVRWYCIGDGKSRKEIENKIIENGLQDKLILLGTKNNPYPYMRDCDLYVQTSRHEGYCITLAEARALFKPIVTTNFPGAMEQIIDGRTGSIVKCDEISLYNKIEQLLKNEYVLKQFETNLRSMDVDNISEIHQLLKMI